MSHEIADASNSASGQAIPTTLSATRITREAYAPFGFLLGSLDATIDVHFTGPSVTYWREHGFHAGEQGTIDILWVNYHPRPLLVEKMETHFLTEQAIIPVQGSPLVHVVAPSRPDAPLPDLTRLQAFYLPGSLGVCYLPGVWHTHFALDSDAAYLMLTRKSSTDEILASSSTDSAMSETSVTSLSELGIAEGVRITVEDHAVSVSD